MANTIKYLPDDSTIPQRRYRAEILPNGLIRVYDYACQWAACFDANGNFRHGNPVKLAPSAVLSLVR